MNLIRIGFRGRWPRIWRQICYSLYSSKQNWHKFFVSFYLLHHLKLLVSFKMSSELVLYDVSSKIYGHFKATRPSHLICSWKFNQPIGAYFMCISFRGRWSRIWRQISNLQYPAPVWPRQNLYTRYGINWLLFENIVSHIGFAILNFWDLISDSWSVWIAWFSKIFFKNQTEVSS